jgi:hypothetical protein
MASTKGGQAEDGELQGERARPHDSGVAASGSGVRVEAERDRETTPAPAPAGLADEWASTPSDRPTSVPTYDVAAVAFETSMRHQLPTGLPLDVAIPTRTSSSVPTHLDLRASFLLLHVDGHASVRDIAEVTGLPFGDVESAFLSLTADGLVELRGTHAVQGVPASGQRTRHDADPDDE